METQSRGLIYEKIPAISAEIGAIGKNRRNEHFRYDFRGIDDLYNALHDALCKHGVFTVPYVRSHKAEATGKGIHVVAEIEYTFFASDGSSVRCCVLGEGADSGDKSANKAMAAAHKYALLQVFAIPTEEQKDSEYDNPDLSGAGLTDTKLEALLEKGRLDRNGYASVPNPVKHPTVAAAEETFGVAAKEKGEPAINDEQFNAIKEQFARLNWSRPHASNWIHKRFKVRAPGELTERMAAAALIELEGLTPEPAKEAK